MKYKFYFFINNFWYDVLIFLFAIKFIVKICRFFSKIHFWEEQNDFKNVWLYNCENIIFHSQQIFPFIFDDDVGV